MDNKRIKVEDLLQSAAFKRNENKRLVESIVANSNRVVTDLDKKLEKAKQEKTKKWRKEQDVIFVSTMDELGIDCRPEFKFHDTRQWRIDFLLCYKEKRLALEIEGGVHTGGRHTSPSGFMEDIEKYNSLTEYGIWLMRVVPSKLNNKETLVLIKKILDYDGKRNSSTLFS